MAAAADPASAIELSSDGLSAAYRLLAADAAAPSAEREAAELYVRADARIEEEDPDSGLRLAEEALQQFTALQHRTGVADSLRLIIAARRAQAEVLRHGEGQRLQQEVREVLQAAEALGRQHQEKFRQAGDRRGEAVMMLAVAEVNYNKRGGKKRAEAEQLALDARSIAKEVGDVRLEATTALLLSNIHIKNRLHDEALAAAEDAQVLYQKVGDRKGEAKALHMVSLGLVLNSELDHGVQMAEQALAIYRELGLKKLEAFELFIMAHYYLTRQKGKEALPLAEEALELFKDLGNCPGYEAHAFDTLVQAYIAKGDEKKAMQAAAEGVERFQRTTDRRGQAIALSTLATAYVAKADTEEAIRLAEEAQTLVQEIGDLRWEAVILQEIAQIHLMRESFEQASQAAKEATELFQSIKDREGEAMAMTALANVHLKRDDLVAAMQVAQEQREIFREIGRKSKEASCLLTVSGCLGSEQNYKEAINLAVEAQELFQEAKDKEGEARALNLLAEMYQDQQEYDLAVEKASEMREKLREVGDKAAEAGALRVLANVNLTFERPLLAVKAANEALALAKKAKDRHVVSEMLILVSQANMALVMKESPGALARGSEKALRPAKEAVKVAGTVGDGELLGSALYQMGKVQLMTLRIAEAMESAREAVDIFRKIDNRPLEADGLLLIAEAHYANGAPDKALDAANEALLVAKACGDSRREWHANQLVEKVAGRRVVYEQVGQQGLPAEEQQQQQAPVQQAVSSVQKPLGLDPEIVSRTVQEMAKMSIGLDDEIFMDSALMDSGMDSLTAVSFRNSLQQTLGTKLPSSLIFDYPTMREVSSRIVELSIENSK